MPMWASQTRESAVASGVCCHRADRDHDHGHRCGVCGVVEQGADAVAGEEADRGEVREQERQRVSHQCSWVVV
jgi:hypothetical protein